MKLKSLNCSARDRISLDRISLESEELEETSQKSKVIPKSEELDTEEFTPEERLTLEDPADLVESMGLLQSGLKRSVRLSKSSQASGTMSEKLSSRPNRSSSA
jgi:hypothetical protein